MDEEVKILCVDDEKSVLNALERLFLDTGYEIITAMSGEEGLEILKNTETVQLVVSDYRMPKMNGVDFLKEVCKVRPDTVRIVLSGYADTAAIVESINEGRIYKFILKPWNDDELMVAISSALDFYFLRRKNSQLTRKLEIKNKNLQKANNNLEHLVEKRTADLKMYNKILICSQNILNSLPIGVVGIDSGGLIVECNSMGLELFSKEDKKMIGMNRRDLFTEDINAFIKKLTRKEICSGQISYNGRSLAVKGRHMRYLNRREGFILIFNEVSTDE